MTWPVSPKTIFTVEEPVLDAPVPLSFPSLIRNPGLADRFAHLAESPKSNYAPPKRNRRDDKEGKRWVKRKENARFAGNPHVVAKGIELTPTTARQTFPEPLPPYLHRTERVPAASPPTFDPNSANAGRFSLSVKGMRKELRRSGFRANALVRDVEEELLEWLAPGGVIIAPDSQTVPERLVGATGSIYEVSRTSHQLVWRITDDAFARYVVHCCARYHSVVSFSKDVAGERLTYLLRPQPDPRASKRALDTPTTTDMESTSQFESDTDFSVSERDLLSEIESESEAEAPVPVSAPRPALSTEGSWSLVEDPEAEGDESGNDADLAASVDSLSIQPADSYIRHNSIRARAWNSERQPLRSASSPSRSPARPRIRRPRSVVVAQTKRGTFYEYLFL
ncbi:hypothetical protein C8J56DRAFT_776916 [Mycena floridula]|nr:hypothetical protein C8J56DRAFT_776916 [Mycena floridula]